MYVSVYIPQHNTTHIYVYFFLKDTATTEIYTYYVVGSVRCV